MPSASVKVEKQAPPETALTDTGTLSPLRQAITIIEHKIRNIEKRKSKLESYRDLQNSGKELNADQKLAVSKYGEVVQTLEFARDLSKQFMGIVIVSEKDAKRLAKKELAARGASELAKVREVLLVQDALNQMGQESVRNDFLTGSNGAATLAQTDLDLLDELYPAVTPKHEAGGASAFTAHVQCAAEHLIAVVDGKQKEAFLGSSYCQIKEVIGKVHESGYLDTEIAVSGAEMVDDTDGPAPEELEPELAATASPVDDEEQTEMVMDCPEQQSVGCEDPVEMHHHMAPQQQRPSGVAPHQAPQQQQTPSMAGDHTVTGYHHGDTTSVPLPQVQAPVPQTVPVLGRDMNSPSTILPHHHHHQQQQLPPPQPQQLPLQQNLLPAMQQQSTIESQQIMHQQQPASNQQALYYPQPAPPRNINEVLGPGSFFFLQDSEIDNPVMAGSGDQLPSINSQTFTNQTYTPSPQSQPSQQPPQQMPMQQPLPQQQQVLPPQQAVANNMYNAHQIHPQQLQQPQQQVLHQHQSQPQHHQQTLHSGLQRSNVSPVRSNTTKHAYNTNSNNASNNGAMNNGGTNNMSIVDDNVIVEKQQHRNVSSGGSGGHRGPPRINSNHHQTHHQQQQQQHQPFYANNGYSNRNNNNRSSGSSGAPRSSRPPHHNQ